MKLFRCQVCDNIIYFENRTCGRCGHRLGYVPEVETLTALEPAGGEFWTPLAGDGAQRRFCANADYDVCNWLTSAGSPDRLCVACRHNDTIPDISQPSHLVAWRDIELAKHRLFYSLLRWKLPLKTRAEDPAHGLAFEFLADPPHPSGPKVMTGHDDGVVTIALAEADSAEIEKRRAELAEPYRSLLGHFRHEVGHHYWDILVRDGGKLEQCRATFGDDTQDYEAALKRHYEQGPPADWPERFVSAYATSHPWEDFAETWAHYLHIVDTLETASAFGVRIAPAVDREGAHFAKLDFDPYVDGSIEHLVEAWTPFVVAMNSVNRAMGRPDLYPFVIAPAVVEKLRFVHDLVRGVGRTSGSQTERAEQLEAAAR
ncbi:MAG: putative zinc-binding peptidase [Roseiarcus sp.]